MKSIWNKLKNNLLLRLGFTLANRHGYLVAYRYGRQVWTNPNRKRPYSLDDDSWHIAEFNL